MAYDNRRRGGRDQGEDTPVRFQEGQPVFQEEGRGGKPRGDKPYINKPYGNKPYNRDGKPAGNRDGKPYNRDNRDNKPYGDKPYNRDNRGGGKPYGDKPYNRDNRDNKPYGDKPYNRDNRDNKPYGDKPYNRDNRDNKPYGDKPYNRDNRDNKPYGDKPYNRDNRGGKPYGKRDEEKPYVPQPVAPVAPVDAPNAREDELPYLVMGRNAVREAIKSGRSVDRILVSREPDGSLQEIISLARDRNLRVDEVGREKLDELCMPFGHGGKTGNHQGIVAQVPGVEYCDISDILDAAKAKGERPFIILLDGIEDPHNLGSIIRSAVCAGAHGVILPKRRAVSVTAAACKASAGAVEYCKVARVSNLSGAIARLKDEGVWIAGAEMGGTPMAEAKLEGALGLVIGGEGDGISHLVRQSCDFMVSIPMYGAIDSLNASVAAAVLMFEKRRQDKAARTK